MSSDGCTALHLAVGLRDKQEALIECNKLIAESANPNLQ